MRTCYTKHKKEHRAQRADITTPSLVLSGSVNGALHCVFQAHRVLQPGEICQYPDDRSAKGFCVRHAVKAPRKLRRLPGNSLQCYTAKKLQP